MTVITEFYPSKWNRWSIFSRGEQRERQDSECTRSGADKSARVHPPICVWYAHWLAGRIANTELIAWNLFSLWLQSVFFHQMVCYQIYFWFTGEQKSWIIDHLCCVGWYHLINGSLSLFYPAIANSYLIRPSVYRATNRRHHNANLLCIYPCDFAASPECHQLIWSSPRRICRPGDCLP